MPTLTECLKTIGKDLSQEEIAALESAREKFARQGYEGGDADRAAVEDMLSGLEKESKDISSQVLKAQYDGRPIEDVIPPESKIVEPPANEIDPAAPQKAEKAFPDQASRLYSMGPGAVYGFEEDEDGNLTFDPEKAILGLVAGYAVTKGASIGITKRLRSGKGIGKFLRGGGRTKGKDSTRIVVKELSDDIVRPDWDQVGSIAEAQFKAEESLIDNWIAPEVVDEPISLRWRKSDDGYYGNGKMAFSNEAFPFGRNTYDIAGCGREAWATQVGIQQTGACYGGKCYAEVLAGSKGRGSVASGEMFSTSVGKKGEREAVIAYAKENGLDAAAEKYPDLVFREYKPGELKSAPEGKISVKKRTAEGARAAKVSTNLQPANGQDIRLGVDTDGSAWLSDPKVMDALLEANPRTLTVYSAAYHAPPPKHELAGRTIINVTVSGWHPLPETLARIEWAKRARDNGWNVILREVVADDKSFTKDIADLYNRTHQAILRTDFFVMQQPLHMGAAHGKPLDGMPGCCVGTPGKNPHTCDHCEVAEGLGKGFQRYWNIAEEGGKEKVLPDVSDYQGAQLKVDGGEVSVVGAKEPAFTPNPFVRVAKEALTNQRGETPEFTGKGMSQESNERAVQAAGRRTEKAQPGVDPRVTGRAVTSTGPVMEHAAAGPFGVAYLDFSTQEGSAPTVQQIQDFISEAGYPGANTVTPLRGGLSAGANKQQRFRIDLDQTKGYDSKKFVDDLGYSTKNLFGSQRGSVEIEGGVDPKVGQRAAVKGGQRAESGVPDTNIKGSGIEVDRVFDQRVDIGRKYAGNINLSRIIAEPADIQKIIAGTADEFATELEAARRGTVTWEQTEKDAKRYGLEDLLGRKMGQALNAEEIENARTLLVASTENLKRLRDVVTNPDTATDKAKAEFLQAFNLHYAIEMQVAGAAAEAGRALRAHAKIAQSDVLKTRQIKELIEGNTGGKLSADELADRLVGIESVHEMTKAVEKMRRATSLDMLTEAWINGLLSGPVTHTVNTLSNSLVAIMAIPERSLAATIGAVRRTQDGVSMAEAQSQAWGLVQGAVDGFKTAARVMRTGEPADELEKIEMRRFRSITAENVQQLPLIQKMAPNTLDQGGWLGKTIDFIGEGVRLPGRALMAEDALFKGIGYRMELNARAMRDAMAQNFVERTDPDTGKVISVRQQMSDHMAKILADPEKHAPDIHLAAIDAGRYQTFTKPLGKAGQNVQQFMLNAPLMRFIAPFIRTPTNILKYAGERSPLAIFAPSIQKELRAGGARADLAMAKIGVGSMAMLGAGWFAAQGRITGGGPVDPKEKAAWRAAGWQPYSIKIGDKWYAYNRLEPLGILLGVSADMTEIMGWADESVQPEIEKLHVAALAAISKNVTSKTWLQGVSEFIEVMSDPERYGGRWLQGYAGSLVPTGVAQIERAISPEMEAVYSLTDAIRARMPGVSSSMPKRRNIWGEQISTALGPDRSWGEAALSLVNPFYIADAKKAQPIDKELVRLGAPISKPQRTQSFDGVDYKMNAQEYDDFIVLMNTVKDDATGLPLRDALNHLVTKDDWYARSHDDDKTIQIRRKFNQAKKKARREIRKKHLVMDQVINRLGNKMKIGR
jgi:hypothetical protein